jgi:uncharacterized membrane-anchored protein YitT (DUF2179 family)
MKSKELFSIISTYVTITIGLAITALGWTGFLIPSKIVGGGVTGFASLIYYTLGWDVGMMVLLMNSILIIIALKILGNSFGIKTIFGVVVFSGFLSLFRPFFPEPIVSDTFMAAVIGGILGGIGGGIVFSKGGSTGGSDIIAMIINKYRNISLGKLLLMIDVVVITSSFLVLQSLEMMVYGYMSLAILSYTIDMVITGNKQSVQLLIISKKHQEITHSLINVANRGVTILDGHGGYTGDDVKVLLVLARSRDSSIIFKIIKQIDPDAFISLGNVMGVYGKGFDSVRH